MRVGSGLKTNHVICYIPNFKILNFIYTFWAALKNSRFIYLKLSSLGIGNMNRFGVCDLLSKLV